MFKALADESRRQLLDQLHVSNGQTLVQLCGHLDMTRQAVAKHLALLEAANLVVSVRRGREKLHYLNPVPIHEISMRWIGKFEQDKLLALHHLKLALEKNSMNKPDFIHTTYIKTTPEKLWAALTNPEFTRQYWGNFFNLSDWRPGSRWQHVDGGDPSKIGVTGEVIESLPPKRLLLTWASPADPADVSRVTFELEPVAGLVRLNVVHGEFTPGSVMAGKVVQGWPLVLASLKSYLESGVAIDIHAVKGRCDTPPRA